MLFLLHMNEGRYIPACAALPVKLRGSNLCCRRGKWQFLIVLCGSQDFTLRIRCPLCPGPAALAVAKGNNTVKQVVFAPAAGASSTFPEVRKCICFFAVVEKGALAPGLSCWMLVVVSVRM